MNVLDRLYPIISAQTVAKQPDSIMSFVKSIEEELAQYDLHCMSFQSEGSPSVIAFTKDTKKPKVLLQAHIDVVPGKANLFNMIERDGRLYGRGVFDMKFAAACYMQLVEDLKNELGDYDFGIMLTSDEEIGGENGVKYLLEQGYEADVCILPDAGDSWNIETSCNGVWIMRLGSSGKSAHGSRPWEGQNAIEHLLDALSDIRQLFGKCEPSKTSLTVSMIEGGAASNQVPDNASATLDMRFRNTNEKLTRIKEVKSIASKYSLIIESIGEVECIETDLNEPHVAKFVEIAGKVRGKSIGTIHSYGASDAHYFCEKGIPTILMRPDGGSAHSDEEWIDKEGLLQYYEVIKRYVIEVAKIA